MQFTIKEITNRQERAAQVSEFFGWPLDLVGKLFDHSKEYFEGIWHAFEASECVDAYYASGFYTIRQMSYTFGDGHVFSGAIQQCLERWKASLLDFGCGVGDYVIAHALAGHECYAIEHKGVPIEFLKYRIKKYGVEDRVHVLDSLIYMDKQVDNAFLLSSLDHVPAPVAFAEAVCKIVKGEIYASPCIDESYDRPTHEKYILRKVPAAFEIIKAHNEKVKHDAIH